MNIKFTDEFVKENDKMINNLSYELNTEDIDELKKLMPERIFFLLHKDGYYQYSFINPKNEFGIWKDCYKDIFVDVIVSSKEVCTKVFLEPEGITI